MARLDRFCQKHIQIFHEAGFVILPGFFSQTEVAAMDKAIEVLASVPQEETKGKQMVYFEDTVFGPPARVLSRIEKFVEYSPALAEVARDAAIHACVAAFFQQKPLLFKEKINFKMSGGRGFEPHQDIQPGWDIYADYFISVLITVDPSTVENGCLELAARQHRRGMIGKKWHPMTGDELDGIEFMPFPTDPGDVVFFDCFVPHQSGPNLTDKSRRNIYLSFNPASQGDHRLQYYEDKRKSFPPDYERNQGKAYKFKV